MAKFYGQVSGSANTVATRRGSANSGIKSTVQSWEGCVITELNEEENGKIILTVSVSKESSSYGTLVFKGTIEELVTKLTA